MSETYAHYQDVLMALCAWREARGEGLEAMRGVCWVIRNRLSDPLNRWPKASSEVVLQSLQFSSFNKSDPNATKFPLCSSMAWEEACQAVDNPGTDPTGGANHYHSGTPPAWAFGKTPCVVIGRLMFYKL